MHACETNVHGCATVQAAEFQLIGAYLSVCLLVFAPYEMPQVNVSVGASLSIGIDAVACRHSMLFTVRHRALVSDTCLRDKRPCDIACERNVQSCISRLQVCSVLQLRSKLWKGLCRLFPTGQLASAGNAQQTTWTLSLLCVCVCVCVCVVQSRPVTYAVMCALVRQMDISGKCCERKLA